VIASSTRYDVGRDEQIRLNTTSFKLYVAGRDGGISSRIGARFPSIKPSCVLSALGVDDNNNNSNS
jgi:hypothetical protein